MMIGDVSKWLMDIDDVDGCDDDDDDDDDDEGDNNGWWRLLLNAMIQIVWLMSEGWHFCSRSFIIDDKRWLNDTVDAWLIMIYHDEGWYFIKQNWYAYHIPLGCSPSIPITTRDYYIFSLRDRNLNPPLPQLLKFGVVPPLPRMQSSPPGLLYF